MMESKKVVGHKADQVKEARSKAISKCLRVAKALEAPQLLSQKQKDYIYRCYGISTARQIEILAAEVRKIISQLENVEVRQDSSGQMGYGTFAWTYKGDTESAIYLGDQFGASPMKGIDSKMGTLIHEASHQVLNYDDHSYGAVGDARLRANVNKAELKGNADTIEHFIELFP